MPTVGCPSCGRALEVEPTYREWTVRCPHCATEFVPVEVAPEAFEHDDRPRRRDDYPNDDDPRRRRRRDPAWDRAEAAETVHAPGLWLELCGWVGGLLLFCGAGFWFFIASTAKNNPNGNGDEGPAILFGLVSAFCAIPYAVVMVLGGRKMRALSGYGWALTASIIGIGSFMLGCFVCVFAFVPVIFGIWGVVALNNPLVVRAFEGTGIPPALGRLISRRPIQRTHEHDTRLR